MKSADRAPIRAALHEIAPPVYFLLHLLAMIGLHFAAPGLLWLSPPWNLAGVFFIVFGAAVTATSARLFTKHQTAIKPFEEPRALVVEGAFQYSRNPMYAGMILILAGVALLLGSLTPLAVLPVFIAVIMTFVQREEQLLEERFGPAYLEYKNGVRRWL